MQGEPAVDDNQIFLVRFTIKVVELGRQLKLPVTSQRAQIGHRLVEALAPGGAAM